MEEQQQQHWWCYWALAVVGSIVIMYGLLELHYFLRMCLCVILARFFKQRCHILDTTHVNGLCLSTDVDTLLYHMNNARYFRELDFARVDFYERTQLYRTIIGMGGSVFQGAATVRYRRFIRPFHRFQIVSRIIYWDDQSVFMEHRFIRPSDKFIHCIAICRQRVIDVSMESVMAALLSPPKAPDSSLTSTFSLQVENGGGNGGGATTTATTTMTSMATGVGGATATATTTTTVGKLKPPVPPELAKWIEYNDISSKNLRNGC